MVALMVAGSTDGESRRRIAKVIQRIDKQTGGIKFQACSAAADLPSVQ